MNEILFLAHRIPFPPDRGDKIRSWHLLKHLSTLGRVHLACFADDQADAAHLPALRAALPGRMGEAHVEVRKVGKAAGVAQALRTGRPISLAMFDSSAMRSFVSRLLERPQVSTVFAFSGQMAQFVPAGARQRFVMDFVDMDSAKFEEYALSGPAAMRWVHRREAEKLLAFERATAARADASLFVSDAEAALFRARTGLPNILSLPNGIDLDVFDPEAEFPRLGITERGTRPLLLFTGQMDYRPNVEAVRWFAEQVLPLVPDARFVIAGRNPTQGVERLAGERVKVTGGVSDMRSWLFAADIVVAPLRIARGVQNKVLEAMAMARPVVASSAAFEGIEAQPGRDLIVEDSPSRIAGAIRDLLASPAARAEIGASGRRQMEAAYRWERCLSPLRDIVMPAEAMAAA